MATKKILVSSVRKRLLSEFDKNYLQALFEPLINEYKTKFIKANSDKKYNYVVDFYTKHYRSYFYLCAKYKAVFENRMVDEFESKFARLEFVEVNRYNLAYYRHTGQWWTVEYNVTAEFCLQNINGNPLFFNSL